MAQDLPGGEPAGGGAQEHARVLNEMGSWPTAFMPVPFPADAVPLREAADMRAQAPSSRLSDPSLLSAGSPTASHVFHFSQPKALASSFVAPKRPISDELPRATFLGEAAVDPLLSGGKAGSLPSTPQSMLGTALPSRSHFESPMHMRSTPDAALPQSSVFATSFSSPQALFPAPAIVPSLSISSHPPSREAHSDSEAMAWSRRISEPLTRYRSTDSACVCVCLCACL
jgi:hypothetical protein